MKGFYIFCDESLKKGRYYSNFYGGILIDKNEFEKIKHAITSKFQDLQIENSELKWGDVNTYKLQQYIEIVDVFFAFVKANSIKVRIMFTDNRFIAKNLTKRHHENQYHTLYYHFLKLAFGLKYIISDIPLDLEIFFDKLPDSDKKNHQFKNYIYGIQFLPEFSGSNIIIKKDSISEVDSKKHILMQCLDVILGAMSFRLNDQHKEKPEGSLRRGKRTIAKEKLYKHINKKSEKQG
ncbi:MAG: DUF3800 domain-containing protein [Bacteroidota bacterium]|nr:DUF3800 domain-containing protein [Bacteroidota bacterium]